MRPHSPLAAVLALAALAAVASCSPSGERARSAPEEPEAVTRRHRPAPYHRAQVVVDGVDVHARPDERSPVTHRFPQHAEGGVVQTFLVEDTRDGGGGRTWHRVLLPVRPAGTTGWVREADVAVQGLHHKLVVRMADFRLDLYRDRKKVKSYPIGIGTEETPTPGGHYYVRDVVQLTDPTSAYGPYAFGLSGFSDVLTTWRGGGVLGIHGTDDPGSIGTRASHGCIRLRNEDVTELVRFVKLGTPVSVVN